MQKTLQHAYGAQRVQGTVELDARAGCRASIYDVSKPGVRNKIEEMNRIDSIYRNGFLLSSSVSETRSIERLGRRSPHAHLVNDLRDELMRTKRVYSMAVCENSLLRTRLKVAEKERRRREDEIADLLDAKNETFIRLGGSKYEDRIQLNSMRKKLLHYERALRERTEQNAELMADQGISRAADLRMRLSKAESECARMKALLAHSVPEVEHLRDKHQYSKVIDRLTEENVQLRKLLDEYDKCWRETKQTLEHVYGGADLIKEFRNSGIAIKQQADFYKNALSSLVHRNRRLNRVLSFKNHRSNSESGVVLPRTRRNKRASLEVTASQTAQFLPYINNINHKRPLASKKSLNVRVVTRGSVKASAGNAGQLSSSTVYRGTLLKRRKLGKMSISLDNPAFSRSVPRMYNNVSSADEDEDEDKEEKDTGEVDAAVTFKQTEDINSKEENKEQDLLPKDSDDSSEAIIYGNGAAVEIRDGRQGPNSSSTFLVSGRLSENLINSNSQYQTFINSAQTPIELRLNLQTPNKDYMENLEALKSEYYETMKDTEKRADRSMEKIARSVQCHILRIKMIGIRDSMLSEYATAS